MASPFASFAYTQESHPKHSSEVAQKNDGNNIRDQNMAHDQGECDTDIVMAQTQEPEEKTSRTRPKPMNEAQAKWTRCKPKERGASQRNEAQAKGMRHKPKAQSVSQEVEAKTKSTRRKPPPLVQSRNNITSQGKSVKPTVTTKHKHHRDPHLPTNQPPNTHQKSLSKWSLIIA